MIFLSSPAMITPHDESTSVGVSLCPDIRFRRSRFGFVFRDVPQDTVDPPFGHLVANLSAVLAFFKLIEFKHAFLFLRFSRRWHGTDISPSRTLHRGHMRAEPRGGRCFSCMDSIRRRPSDKVVIVCRSLEERICPHGEDRPVVRRSRTGG